MQPENLSANIIKRHNAVPLIVSDTLMGQVKVRHYEKFKIIIVLMTPDQVEGVL